ncbi:MAG: hypothetical protein AB7G47_19900 [Mycolicibacterium sp.]|uniref:hypothetical protein n=1 Tax=Mycolicibacterium sp. TaxID=2320850 RepID=UPI003D11E2F8
MSATPRVRGFPLGIVAHTATQASHLRLAREHRWQVSEQIFGDALYRIFTRADTRIEVKHCPLTRGGRIISAKRHTPTTIHRVSCDVAAEVARWLCAQEEAPTS